MEAGSTVEIRIDIPKFVICYDDREKKPFQFPQGVEVVRAHLPFGDYSVVGLEKRVAIERKSISDLVGTLWSKSELADGSKQSNLCRFAYELERMSSVNTDPSLFVRRYVVVEGSEDDLRNHFTFRQHTIERFGHKQRANFASTVGLISSLEMRYGSMFVFCRNREAAAAKVYASLYHFYRYAYGLSRDPVGDYKPPHDTTNDDNEKSGA